MTPKKIFWIRFSLWTLFALLLPLAFLVWRFDLFAKVSRINIGGWGLLAIILIAVFVGALYKYMKRGLPYSLLTQIIGGVVKIILPLCWVAFAVYITKSNLDYVSQLLGVLIICEAIAIPLNPMPKWVHDNRENEVEGVMDLLLKNYEKRKEGK